MNSSAEGPRILVDGRTVGEVGAEQDFLRTLSCVHWGGAED